MPAHILSVNWDILQCKMYNVCQLRKKAMQTLNFRYMLPKSRVICVIGSRLHACTQKQMCIMFNILTHYDGGALG